MRRSWILTLPLSVIVATALMSAASDQPQIVQTGCDTISVAPLQFRVQFRVENLGEYDICNMWMSPLQPTSPDTCSPPITQCEAPSGWFCSGGDGSAFWYPSLDPRTPCIAPGETLDLFAVITDVLPSCCYRMAFYAGPLPEPNFVDVFCFTCVEPVPVRSGTWGRLKLLYR